MSAIKYAFVALALKSFFADALESGLKVTRKLEEELGWSYSGENGPAFWAELYPDCAGKSQSPIDFSPKVMIAALARVKKNSPNFSNLPPG